MARYAQLSNNIVANVIESELDPDGVNGEWVLCGDAGPGWLYDGEAFTPPVPVEDPRLWWIDTGPWKDRFDTVGYPGLKGVVLALGRTNDACYAANADLVGRLYVDIKGRRAELAPVLQTIAAVVLAAGKPEFTTAMQNAMLDTPTTEAERHIKGLA